VAITVDAPLILLGLLVVAAAVLSGAVASLTAVNRQLRQSAAWWENAAGALVPWAEARAELRSRHSVTYPDGSYTVICDEPIGDVIGMHVTAGGERRLIRHEQWDPWRVTPERHARSR
jgi:hypothetical protein